LGQLGDEVTFGAKSSGTWDQFAANEEKFGITTKFDENVYTTVLDRSAKDFKEKERKAERLAAEISGVSGYAR
jgi:PAB1-binding protein PBP1